MQTKAQAVNSYSEATGADKVNPVMLVVARDISDANDYGDILRSSEFFAGTYAESVLVVHSKSPDEALEALSRVEDPGSPIRIIISVGMLKEGWDVKNVYVIASMRASVSDILTEQTLGRGMRLPFGAYTGMEILDTVEVVAHEKYQSPVRSSFTLADITDTDAFRNLGASLAADPDGELNRTLLSAKVVTGSDGLRRTELVTYTAADKLKSASSLLPEADLRKGLTEMVLSSPAVPSRKDQVKAFQPLLNSFMDGIGSQAIDVLSANQDRAGARLIQLVEREQRRFMSKPSFHEVIKIEDFDPVRVTDRTESEDRFGAFSRSVAYKGWKRSTMPIVWFDSSTERTIANAVDDDEAVAWWVRLQVNDLPILWNSAGRNYNPDLIVIEKDGTHWIVEAKMNKEMQTAEVQEKKVAARRWANYVTADESVEHEWKYLLLSEDDVSTAKGSWPALKKLGS